MLRMSIRIKLSKPSNMFFTVPQANIDSFQTLKSQHAEKVFQDSQFPPTKTSISVNWSKYLAENSRLKPNELVWRRGVDFIKGDPQVFAKIEPNDILQGGLGDCYYLSALSVLAEKPDLVKRLFYTKTF